MKLRQLLAIIIANELLDALPVLLCPHPARLVRAFDRPR
jgi:SAM-dependent MidA family methyltransferase